MKPATSGTGYEVDSTGNYFFTLSNNQTMRFRNLPWQNQDGSETYTYSIVETSTGSYTTTYSPADGSYNPAPASGETTGTSGTVTITNKKTTTETVPDVTLSIHKEKKATPSNTPLEGVTFTLTNASGETVDSGATANGGDLTLTIPGAQLGLHNGAGDTTTEKTFTLTETVPEGYKAVTGNPWTVTVRANGTTVSGSTTTYNWQVVSVGSLTGNQGVYTIENEEESQNGDLSLAKTLASYGANSGTKLFTFQVVLESTGLAADQTYALEWSGTERPDSGVAAQATNVTLLAGTGDNTGKFVTTVEIAGGETATITGLPQGVTYTVSEINIPAGYSETNGSIGKTGTISATVSSVSIVNEYAATGSTALSAQKTFANGNLNSKTFSFKVTQMDGLNSDSAVTENVKLSSNPKTVDTSTSGNQTVQTVNFGTLSFTAEDAGHDFYFKIEEDTTGITLTNGVDTTNHIKYADPLVKWVKVSVTDNGDGSLSVTKTNASNQIIDTVAPDAAFTNEQLGSLTVHKTVSGGDNTIASYNVTIANSAGEWISAESARCSVHYGKTAGDSKY